MSNKYLIRIINEEIKKFDFLGNEESLKEQESIDLLMNEDLQKQFICDSLLKRMSKIKIVRELDGTIGGNWNDNPEDVDELSVEYNINVEYKYDETKEPLTFDLAFNGNNVGINIAGSSDRGDYLTPAANEKWINTINWYEINVSIFSKDREEIEFVAFEKAPQKIQNLFVREYLETLISTKTSMDIDVRNELDSAAIVQYC